MTGKTEAPDRLPEAVHRFVLHWGHLGERWGVTRSVSQVHALLYLAERPLTADEIAEKLNMARSNVSTSLRELSAWKLIQRVPILGDRRDFYAAETDLWTMAQRIAAGRKARELDPAALALRECLAEAEEDLRVSPQTQRRLEDMLDFLDRMTRWYEQMLALPKSQAVALMKLGAGAVRLLDKRKLKGEVRAS